MDLQKSLTSGDKNAAWRERLNKLPPEKQAMIANKYYGGRYVWNDSGRKTRREAATEPADN